MSYGKTQKLKKNFSSITVSLASPESILERSYGEVLKPETINLLVRELQGLGLEVSLD